VDIRSSLEKEKLKNLKEFQRVEGKFNSIGNVIDALPSKVLKCEVQCKNSEDTAVQIKSDMDKVNSSCI
jgi:hypothetical protein